MSIRGSLEPDPPRSTPQQLREYVHKFEPYAFLRVIAEVAGHEDKDDPIGRLFPRALNSWGLADLARYVLQYGSEHRSRRATVDDVRVGMNLVNGMEVDLSDTGSAFSFLYRTTVKQFPDQYDARSRIARMLVLFDDLPQAVETRDYDIRARFRGVTGLTVAQFTWVSFAIWSRAIQAHELDPAMIIGHDIPQLRDEITEASVRSTLRQVSSTLREFRERSEQELRGLVDDPVGLYSFNPLYTTPLIRVPGPAERYVAPVPKLLLRRLSDGPYYLLLEADKTRFTEAFGPVFQEYVEWLLRGYDGQKLRREFTYWRNKAQARSPDWFVEDENPVSMIECKSGRITKLAKTTATREERREAFVKIYGPASKQLARFVEDIPLTPEAAWIQDRRLESFVVLLDPIYLANSAVWAEEREAARHAYGVAADFDPGIITAQALEVGGAALSTKSLAEHARIKREDPERRNWDWETYWENATPNPALLRRWDDFAAIDGQ